MPSSRVLQAMIARHQQPQQRLEVHALPHGQVLGGGPLRAGADELRRLAGRLPEAGALHQRPGEDAGEHISGAVEGVGHIGGLHRLRPARPGVKAHGAGVPGVQRGAGQHHGPAALQAQRLHDLPVTGLVAGQGVVGAVQQQRRLRQIGGDDIRLLRQAGGARAHGGGVGLVDLAVVAHHRVHHHQGVRFPELPDERLHNADLLLTAQKAAVDGLELQVQGLPVGGHLGHLAGHVQEGEPLEPAGVGGEKGGGQGAALDAHGGEDGDGDGQGAPAEAGQVVDRSNAGGSHGRVPLFKDFAHIGSYCSVDFPIVQEVPVWYNTTSCRRRRHSGALPLSNAGMMKLVNMLDLGSSAARLVGSSPTTRTN